VWAYCLMPNHVHLILTPGDPHSLAQAVGETHRRYTLAINRREGWKGYLWQGRFASFPMDMGHLVNATRYVLLNPVRAGLVERARDWPHSSARAHFSGKGDGVVAPTHLARWITDWGALLEANPSDLDVEMIRRHQRTGRPMGSDAFIRGLEERVGRRLRPRKAGRRKGSAPEKE
jgi:putative transposase